MAYVPVIWCVIWNIMAYYGVLLRIMAYCCVLRLAHVYYGVLFSVLCRMIAYFV